MHLFLFTNSAHGMEAFLTKNEQEDGTVLRLRKPRRNGTGMTVLLLRTERNRTKRERND